MEHKSENCNLLVEPWIPVLYTNGKPDRVGIWKALTEAVRIRQIAASNPMDNVALLRLLLALLQWCKPSMSDEERKMLEEAEGIPDTWLKKRLGGNERPNVVFDLLNSNGGFFQDQGAGGVRVSVMNLMHDVPSGSKIAHFRHTRDESAGMCLPCCAMGLVRWTCVASAGTAGAGQSMTASINGNTPAYSVPEGSNLLTTLLFTWPFDHLVQGDVPVWDAAEEHSPLGFLKGMTWRTRRILLAPPSGTSKRDLSRGSCSYCGQPTETLVRTILFRPGWKRPSKEPWSEDPHLLQIMRRNGPRAKEKKTVPMWPNPNEPLEEHAGIWRMVLQGLLQRAVDSETGPITCYTMLLASSQALYKHVGIHRTELPKMSADVAERLSSELTWLTETIWITVSARARNWSKPPRGDALVAALCAPGAKGRTLRSGLCARSALTEGELERAFLKLAHGLADGGLGATKAPQQVVDNWRGHVSDILRKHVQEVIVATTPGSQLRRQEAVQKADSAVRNAVRQVEQQQRTKLSAPSFDTESESEHDAD